MSGTIQPTRLVRWGLIACWFVLAGCQQDSAKPLQQQQPPPQAEQPAVAAIAVVEPGKPPTLGSKPPEPAKTVRTVDVTPARVKAGKALFGTCIGCHGDGAAGRIGIGPRIASETYLEAASDEFLIATISKGRAGTTMVPWGGSLKDDQIASLVAYLRSLYPTEPAKLDHTPAQGNSDNGRLVFRNICSGCHGRNGAGYQETANGTGIGRKAFLDTAPDGFIRHVLQHGKSLTQMKGFGKNAPAAVANLTDQEVNDTIAYLRRNAW